MSLYEMFQQRWTDRKKTAIIFGEERWTWADLDHRVRQAYRWLDRLGTQPEDVLALQLPKCIDQQALMLAALARGLITLPLNPSYTTRECQRALTDSRSKVAVLLAENTALSLQDGLVFSADTLAAELDSSTPAVTLNHPPMDSVGFLCYTSGTTGPPKGALITQGNVLHTLQALHKIWHWSAADHLVHVLPLFHIHGLFAAQFGAYLAGATTEWFDKFEPNQVLAALSRVSSGVFMGVPTSGTSSSNALG
jgi:malonyl-CoA/methylmalonyl-CoA synthetase